MGGKERKNNFQCFLSLSFFFFPHGSELSTAPLSNTLHGEMHGARHHVLFSTNGRMIYIKPSPIISVNTDISLTNVTDL